MEDFLANVDADRGQGSYGDVHGLLLRVMKLMRGGKSARREAELMVSEMIHAAFEATASLMAGASGDKIVHRYRRHVAANANRLGKLNSGRSRSRALKGARRRRK